MIFNTGDILQFVLEKSEYAFSFTLCKRGTDNQHHSVVLYSNEKHLVTRDAHRFNLLSGEVPTIDIEYDNDEYDNYYPNRPYSQYVKTEY